MKIEDLQPQETGLAADLDWFIQWTPATKGQRFLNYLIDNLLMQYGLGYVTGLAIGFLLMELSPEFADRLFSNTDSVDFILFAYTLLILNYLIYYTFCEKVFRGYTLGKLITGTRAIRDDGKELTLKNALLRSLSRMVPFEAFSALGNAPWHDTWTGSQVIKSR